jgi:hypothetical protein
MTDNPNKFDDPLITEPTHELGFLGDVKIHQDAEDVVTIRLLARDTDDSVDSQVTDNNMIQLAEAAKAAFTKIHGSMASIFDALDRGE